MNNNAMQARACLFGGAMGDALGAEVEFWSLDRIRRAFPEGLTEMPAHRGRPGRITDDTQMTLFTAEGLIRAVVRGLSKGIVSVDGVVHHALLRWYRTQGGRPQMDVCDIGLIADARLHAARAPGNTCLSALGAATAWGAPARNDSKGCGTIMRVAPVALVADSAEQAMAIAASTSALTHGHVLGQQAAMAFARILFDVRNGRALETATRDVDLSTEIGLALGMARNADRDGCPETVETLGGGWVAEEALSIAVYAALCARDFEHGLRIAVTHSGDSDSTGAIAGNLLGLMFPEQALAHRWLPQLECADLIDRLARDLAKAREPDDRFVDEMWTLYPGW